MKLPAAALLAFAIAACNSQNGGGTNQAAGPAPSPPAAAETLRPGRWEMTARLVSLDMPSAPPETREMLRAQSPPPPQVTANCVTPEEASDLLGSFRRQILQTQPNLSCQVGDQRFGGGQIRFSMNCRGMNGQPDTRMAIVGNFTDGSVRMAVSADSSMTLANGTVQSARLETMVTGQQVGACNGTETD
jgi:hypothetical protein